MKTQLDVKSFEAYEESKDEKSHRTDYSDIKKAEDYYADTFNEPDNINEEATRCQYVKLIPYSYQIEIWDRIRKDWQEQNNQYGHIVYLETGMGKTHTAVMLLNTLFNDIDYSDQHQSIMEPSSDDVVVARKVARENNKGSSKSQKVFFIVPVQNLVEQQAALIERYTNLVVGRYHGQQKRSKYYSQLEAWREEFQRHDVFVAMAKKFYDLLMHGFVKMEEISIIVFDECHHTDQDHLYNLIMRDFFFHKLNDKEKILRPKILGLTASPIKQKIERQNLTDKDVESMLQNLSNNLYSRFVTLSAEQVKQLSDNLQMSVEKYQSNFDWILHDIELIEKEVVKKIAQLVQLPEGTYKIQEIDRTLSEQQAQQIMDMINTSFVQDSVMSQNDGCYLKFLKGRRNIIELNSTWTKQGIDLAKFKDQEDKLLVLMCFIMLKKINNLLIELGITSVKTFFTDLKNDLLVFGKNSNQFGEKKQQAVEIIQNFCSNYSTQIDFDQSVQNQKTEISNKVEKLVKILEKSYDQNPNIKTIIFVKDRSVAYYLSKILQSNTPNELNEAHQQDGLLRPNVFKVGLALGQNQKSLINQAYKSTNVQRNDIFKDLQNMPSCSSVKVSPSLLRETLQNFKNGRINVLIATNVVEEGLDVSTCNQVICMNELSTVKAFIQMKGRARQKDSKFVFLCSEEESEQAKEDQRNFTKVIEIMKKITLRGENQQLEGSVMQKHCPEIKPLENICFLKAQDEQSYHEEPITRAKISMRDAKQLIELFCFVIAENKIKFSKLMSIDDSTMSSNHLESKPNYVTKEAQRGGIKYYYAVLYMPECCKDVLKKVNPLDAFVKKRDAENHVALTAVKKLRERNLIDEYLFPSSSLTNGMVLPSLLDVITPSPLQSQSSEIIAGFDPSQPRKKKQISDEEKLKAHQSSKQFQQKIKQEKQITELDQIKNLVNKVKFVENFDSLQIFVFKGVSDQDEYPYRTTKDFIGFLFDRSDFCQPSLVFTVFQESKQRDKNMEHLDNLFRKLLIKKEFYQRSEQIKDEIDVQIGIQNSISLFDDLKKQDKLVIDKKFSNVHRYLTKLQFFHTWMFYYLYSADHKFIKALFKYRFPFVPHLFSKVIEQVKSKHYDSVRVVYGEKAAKSQRKQENQSGHSCYTVPVRQTRNGLQVNWDLIDRVIDYVRNRILELRNPTERHLVISKYNLEETSKVDPNQMIQNLWDSKFQGNRHVVIGKKKSCRIWDLPVDLNQGRKDEQRQFADQIKRELMQNKRMNVNSQPFQSNESMDRLRFILSQSGMSDEYQFNTVSVQKERQILMTPQEYYFIKQGQLHTRRFNKFIFKCRKERHFVDFGKKRKDDQQFDFTQAPRKVNTIFDLPDQMLTLSPLSYNQYQIMQQTCYHMLNLNEFLLIEKFINTFFQPELGKCLMQWKDNKKQELVPCSYSTKLFMTQEQIKNELGDQVQLVSTKQQLQTNLFLIREALTAPSACRDYDYERLEFYGDSIIGFLVILELFLLNPSSQEGDLDFLRIQRVSNENFYKINRSFKFFKYMITDPHHVFSGFLPSGFNEQEQINYQNKITVKTYNELNNKYKELKKIKERLRNTPEKDDLTQMFLNGDLYTLVRILLKDRDMVKKVSETVDKQISDKLNSLVFKQDKTSVLLACKILFQSKTTPLRIFKMCVDVCIEKTKNQIIKQQKIRDQKNQENRRQNGKKKQIYYKQFADVVESVAGAVTIVCGLNLTQSYLKSLGILQNDQQKLKQELIKLIQSQKIKESALVANFYKPFKLAEVEKIIGYTFKCKSWLVQALTHKSYIDQSIESTLKMRLDDYERLEFLGDSVLNYLIAKFFFLSTQYDQERKMPKELHKMKTAVINNTLLSLIVIEYGIYEHIIYNKKAVAFKEQFEKYVKDVDEMVSQRGTTSEIANQLKMFEVDRDQIFDLDSLYESGLKIFGDVFESLIGAVFLDCNDIDQTWSILERLIMPYVEVYADLETLQDHARTKLLELWNQRPYTKRFKCTHESKQLPNGDEIRLTAILVGHYPKDRYEIFSETYKKDAKNKNRAFYKKLFMFVQKFIQQVDSEGPGREQWLIDHPQEVKDSLRRMILSEEKKQMTK